MDDSVAPYTLAWLIRTQTTVIFPEIALLPDVTKANIVSCGMVLLPVSMYFCCCDFLLHLIYHVCN